MKKEDIKRLIIEIVEARIYNRPLGTDFRTSTEYALTPEEQLAWKGMDLKQRQKFATMKLHQARKAKGICIQCGKKPSVTKPDGTRGTYCQDCLDRFRVAREKLVNKRNSCSRCANPPIPGKKLCQKCTDELEFQRLRALANNLCIRCKKVPMEPNERGEPTLFCRKCMKIKVELNKRRKKYVKNWKDFGHDVVSSLRAKKIANLDPNKI